MADRIFYACQAVFFSCPKTGVTDNFLNGVQSISVRNTLDNIPINDNGRAQSISLYTEPQNEITIERVFSNLDGILTNNYLTPANYSQGHILNPSNLGVACTGNPSTDLSEYSIKLAYSDPLSETAQGTALDIVTYYKALLTSLSYEFSVGSVFKESITFSNKITNKEVSNAIPVTSLPIYLGGTKTTNLEVLRRSNFDLVNSVLPTSVNTIAKLGDFKSGQEIYGITSIKVDLSIDYERMKDTGKWRGSDVQSQVNLWTTVKLPLSISCSFTVTGRREYANSILNSDKNFLPQRIVLVIKTMDPVTRAAKYKVVDLGTKNYLNSLEKSGGSTSGDNLEFTLQYKNTNNDFSTYDRSDTNINSLMQTTEIY